MVEINFLSSLKFMKFQTKEKINDLIERML